MPAALLVLLLARTPAQVPPKSPPELVVNLQWALGAPVDADWQPLHLDLQSASSKDLDLEIILQESISATRIVRREALPAQGRRRLFLYLPTGRLSYAAQALRPELSVRNAEGRELAAFTLAANRGGSDDDVLLGLLSASTSQDVGLGLGWRTSTANVQMVHLTPELVPDRWTGLAPLRALLLHDAPLDALGPDQARAIRDYVRQGGTLVVSPGGSRAGLSHPVLAALAEIRAAPAETRAGLPALSRRFTELPAAAPFRFHPILNGRPLAGLEDSGIARFEAGFGRVLVLPFELRQAPFHGWTGLTGLMSELIGGAPRTDAAWAGADGLPGDLAGADGRTRLLGRMLTLVNPYPSFLLLLGLTVVYLVLVGPLNYMLLRRLRMTLLLVVTVPALSLGFLALTLGVAYLVKGRSTTVTSVRLLAAVDGLPCARETGVTALFSPSTRAYAVAPPPGRAAIPFKRLVPRERQESEAGPLEMEDAGGDSRFRAVTVGQWQSWAFETRAVVDLGAGIRWSARGGVLRIENGSGLEIERAVFIRAGRGGFASPVGAVAPGAAVEAALDVARWSPLEDLGFDELSLGACVLAVPLRELQMHYRAESGESGGRQVLRQEEVLVCVVRDAGPGAEVDARRAADSRSLTLLFVREERP
jgi:hypothetical protein